MKMHGTPIVRPKQTKMKDKIYMNSIWSLVDRYENWSKSVPSQCDSFSTQFEHLCMPLFCHHFIVQQERVHICYCMVVTFYGPSVRTQIINQLISKIGCWILFHNGVSQVINVSFAGFCQGAFHTRVSCLL